MLTVPVPQNAWADGGRKPSLNADLDGFQEVPLALSTAGNGELRVRFNRHGSSFEYKLSYEDLEGIVTQAHIHFGRPGVNGGISAWLCGTSAIPGPAGTPTCPGPNSGEVVGTITSAQVVGPAAQGIAPGEFDELVRAMREGATYANVHTDTSPGGEIRGHIDH
jgi:hypothetical protein